MNRFFSKLNLHDIKIHPEGKRFPPDADDDILTDDDTQGTTHLTEPADAPATRAESPAEDLTLTPAPGDGPASDLAADPEPEITAAMTDTPADDAPVAAEPAPETTEARQAGYYIDGEFVGMSDDVLKVSARSRPSAVAGAIAGVVREVGKAEVQAIGAGATNQAIKAVAIARDYLKETGIEAICIPAFIDVTIDNEDRTAIRLVVEPR